MHKYVFQASLVSLDPFFLFNLIAFESKYQEARTLEKLKKKSSELIIMRTVNATLSK